MSGSNSTSDLNYHQYLDSIQNMHHTPAEILTDKLTKITGYPPIRFSKIVAGEANEVYVVLLEDKTELIVRIHHTEDENPFNKEAWAIKQCEIKSIPVPEMIAIDEIDLEGAKSFLCIQKKLSGEPLERGSIDMWQLDPNVLKKLMHKAGELLNAMHSIVVTGYGSLNNYGKGETNTFTELVRQFKDSESSYILIAKDNHFPELKMHHAIDLLVKNIALIEQTSPVFNHGDFAPKHIMVEKDIITGIIDFGEIKAHHTLFDLAHWDFWFGSSKALTWLMEGYELKAGTFDDVFRILKLQISLEVLWWYAEKKYLPGINHALKALDQIIN